MKMIRTDSSAIDAITEDDETVPSVRPSVWLVRWLVGSGAISLSYYRVVSSVAKAMRRQINQVRTS